MRVIFHKLIYIQKLHQLKSSTKIFFKQPSQQIHFTISLSGFRLNTTVWRTENVLEKVDCVIECVAEPCCRSINYKKTSNPKSKSNCEMLHHVMNEKPKKLVDNSSYDHVYLINPQKVSNLGWDSQQQNLFFSQLSCILIPKVVSRRT